MEEVTITKERLEYLEKCANQYNKISLYLDEMFFLNREATTFEAILNLIAKYHDVSASYYHYLLEREVKEDMNTSTM